MGRVSLGSSLLVSLTACVRGCGAHVTAPDGGGEKEGKEEGEVRKSGEDGDEDDEPEVEEDLENDDYAAGEFFFAVNLVFRMLTLGIFSCLALERSVVFGPSCAISRQYTFVPD